MCGIAGIFESGSDSTRRKAELHSAIRRIRVRGPDGVGAWSDSSSFYVGHARLSIIDLSDLASQPMVSPCGRFVVSFNGEIYNYTDLRRLLSARGHVFRSTSDTEVLLLALKEWGTDALSRLNGMFALAFWDSEKHRGFLARDRMGVKPLLYAHSSGALAFASELSALKCFGGFDHSLSLDGLGEFLSYGFISGSNTISNGARRLQPGHFLTFGVGLDPQETCYWSPDSVPPVSSDIDDAVLEERLEELLVDSARLRMISDVPVGIFLSGGVDSTLVTALLSQSCADQLSTFTIGFSENEFDESQHAREVAMHFGTKHHERYVSETDALDVVKRWGRLFDEPFGDSSGIPTHLVSLEAKEHVKVVLSADGGDEMFGGYQIYPFAIDQSLRFAALDKAPRLLASALSNLIKAVGHGRGAYSPAMNKLRRLAELAGDRSLESVIDCYRKVFYPDQIGRLLGGHQQAKARRLDVARLASPDPYFRMALHDIKGYLPGDILTKVDRATMACSIEGREPLLDYRLVELALALPSRLKAGELGQKHILKKILYKRIPRQLVDRPKQGFAVPLLRWLQGPLRGTVMEQLNPDRVRYENVFDSVEVEKILRSFYDGASYLKEHIWYLLAFQLWKQAQN